MDVARKCHAEMRQKTGRVITFMKIDDYGDRAGRLTGAIACIEGKLGKPVKPLHRDATSSGTLENIW
jgi:hypothetical protein